MMAVIFVFLILLIFGIFWFFQQGVAQAGDLQEENFRLQLLEKTKEIMSLPEIQCSFAAVPDTSCVDAYRVQAFATKVDTDEDFEREYLERFFGQTLRIELVYPEQDRFPPRIDVFDFAPAGSDNYQTAVIPITIYDPLTELSYLGVLILENHDLTVLP